jgi:membrane peptidoglycan carboxypeptidase
MHSKNASLTPCPELGIDKAFLDEIIKGMRKATEQGTARRCHIKGISIAGKTGTGQWRNHNMNLNLAWFVGFAPVEKARNCCGNPSRGCNTSRSCSRRVVCNSYRKRSNPSLF